MSSAAHLEQVFSDAYQREIDQDESVWRSLPFFATSLALYAALLGYVASKLPPISLNGFHLAGYGLIAASAAFLTLSFGRLWYSVHTRVYRQIPLETDTLTYVDGLRHYHSQLGLTGAALEDQVVEETRQLLVRQLADATSHNRLVNGGRLRSRSLSIRFLMFSYLTLGVLALCVFASEKLAPIAQATLRG